MQQFAVWHKTNNQQVSIYQPADFQSVFLLSHWADSNRRPTHYECVALPTEPQWQYTTR